MSDTPHPATQNETVSQYVATHWFGCWKTHHGCAMGLVDRAAALLDRVPAEDYEIISEPRGLAYRGLKKEIEDFLLMVHGPEWRLTPADGQGDSE